MNFNNYQNSAVGTAVYPGANTPLGIMYCALKLNGEAGELAEHIGKAIRDDGFGDNTNFTDDRYNLIVKELGDVLWYVAAIATELDIELDDVAQININKLNDRKARGTLGGSGDTR